MFSKFGKEIQLFKTDNFRVKYGTVDAVKLKAIYLNIESWVQPLELINFDSKIRSIRKDIILKLNKTLDKTLFLNNFIVDLDLRSSGMVLNKKSFMFIEVTIYPKVYHKFNSIELVKTTTEIASTIINLVQSNNFKFYATKKH